MSWRTLLSSYRAFWTAEHSLSVLLALLILLLFVATPLVSGAVVRSELTTAFFSLVAISGVAAVAREPAVIAAAGLGAALSIGLDWVAHFRPGPRIELADLALRIGFVGLLASLVLAQVFRPGEPSHHRVQGEIVVYLLAGLAWGYVYDVIGMLDAAAFHVVSGAAPVAAYARTGLFRYFSFETLTTLGLGDVLPVSPLARSLASLEALFGQLYPAAMIARLISLEIAGRRWVQEPRRAPGAGKPAV